mgnify:CR=1 FL=1
MRIHTKIKYYFQSLKKQKVQTSMSAFCHLSSSKASLGYYQLNFLREKINKFDSIYYFIRSTFSIMSQNLLISNNKLHQRSYDCLCITWGRLENFVKDGSFYDRYFNQNSKKNKKILWCIIYSGEKLPKKINDNIIILSTPKSYNMFNFFLALFKEIIFCLNNPTNFFHRFTSQSYFARKISKTLLTKINLSVIKKIIIPYEGQPFQNYLIFCIKKYFPHIRTLGYLHYAHPLQLDIFHREGSPDLLLTHSADQKKYIIKNLQWKKNKVCLVKSARFRKSFDKKKISNMVFLPYYIDDKENLLRNLENFLKKVKIKSLPILKVKKHPFPYNQSVQIEVSKLISKILNKYNYKFDNKNKKKVIIVIGLSTTPLLALEKNIKVYHLTQDRELELFSNTFWPSLYTKKIIDNCYLYFLRRKNYCIKLGNSNADYLQKYLKNNN